MINFRSLACGALLTGVLTSTASAAPLLQLDIAGGVYDSLTQTIVSTGSTFVLSAILTPKAGDSAAKIAERLNETYYISIGLTPAVGPVHSNAGAFSVNGTTVNATSGMTYGVPPIEDIASLQGADPGDLPGHNIYPTFFKQIAFKFSPSSTAATYDSALTPGGLVPTAGGGSYFASFTIDTSALDPRYQLHFDLYDRLVIGCGIGCKDIDTEHWAPFTHDAQSRRAIPEPRSAALLSLGFLVAVGFSRRFALIG